MITDQKLQNRPYWKHALRLLSVRNLVFLVLFVALFIIGLRLVAPLLIPPGAVRDQIENAIAERTGYRVSVYGSSSVSFWPFPKVEMNDVTLLPTDKDSSQPLMTIARVSGSFSILSAIRGNPSFGDFELQSPEVFIRLSKGENWNWKTGLPAGGGDSVSQIHLGTFNIRNGLVHFDDGADHSFDFKQVDGKINWQSFASPLSFNMRGKLRGKDIKMSGSSSEPDKLASGKTGQMSLTLASALGNISYTGVASLFPGQFFDGHVTADTSDAKALSDWLGMPFEAFQSLKATKIDADIKTEGFRFTLTNTSLTVDGAKASGVLSCGWDVDTSKPFLSGTLAFDHLNIGGFLGAFSLAPSGANVDHQKISTKFLSQFQLDLSLSADNATFGKTSLQDVAASARVSGDHASFALATARLGNGHVTGDLSLQDDPASPPAWELHLQGRRIDIGGLQKQLAISGPELDADASFAVDLHVKMPAWQAGRSEIDGTMKLNAGAGSLKGFSVDKFRGLASTKRYFDLSDAGDGSFSFDSASFSANIENGIAELLPSYIKSADTKLNLKGVIPYKNNSLAISGTLSAPTGTQQPDLHFFAGGAWPDIVISSISTLIDSFGEN